MKQVSRIIHGTNQPCPLFAKYHKMIEPTYKYFYRNLCLTGHMASRTNVL